MKISFDFDSVLSGIRMQNIAKSLITAGHEVWITTTRKANPPLTASYNNTYLFLVAETLNIPRERIQFTECKDKYLFLDGFDVHFDDDEIEIELLKEHLPSCLAILY